MSLNNQQFPPSSPVLNSTDDQFAPSLYSDLGGKNNDSNSIITKEKLRFFKDSNNTNKQQQQQISKPQDELYPTPNPSSSMGVLTSPIKPRNIELNPDSPLQLKTKNTPITPVSNHNNNNNDKDTNNQQSQTNNFDSRSASPITTTQHLYIKKPTTENKLSHQEPNITFENSNNNNSSNNQISLISPLDKVKRLKIPFNGRIINIGRSSKSSQCVLPSKNKLISRIHCSVQMVKPDSTNKKEIHENSIIVKCLGWNGINITVPTLVDVEQMNSNDNGNPNGNQFKISKRLNKNEVDLKNLKFKNRILCQEKSVTNFYMLKNESFIIPLIPGLLLDFRGECVLLEYENESDLTDDEQENADSVILSHNDTTTNNNNTKSLKHKLDQTSQQGHEVDDDENKKRKLSEDKKVVAVEEQKITLTVNSTPSVTHITVIRNTTDSTITPAQPLIEIKHEEKDKKLNVIKEVEKKQKKTINNLSRPSSSSSSSSSNTNIASLNTPVKSTKTKSTVYIHNDKSSASASSNTITSTPVTNLTPKQDRLLKLRTKSKINSKSLSPSPSPSPAVKKTANLSVSTPMPSLSSTPTTNPSHKQSLKLHLSARKPLADITDKMMNNNNNGKKTSSSTNTVKQHRRSRSSELHKVTKRQHSVSTTIKSHNDKENRAVSMSPKQIKKYQKKEENMISTMSKASDSLNNALSLADNANKQQGEGQGQQVNSETLVVDENNATPPQVPQKKMANYTKEEVSNVLKDVKDLSEICNVLGNHLAFSRVSSTPLRQVFALNAIQSHKLTIEQLRAILIHHLEFIGVIYREGKDAAGKPLDEEYYYIPEKDKDQGRVKLAEELKGPGAGLRSCRKTHKQYFWKKPTKK
ncbi:hypothetical protein BVG19_g3217 [[Candida] boidinii]|nr:hypothetical protein BVG19_g3217 [[Candida] boidinii]OWB51735.1 hypothetical protein B5S27_g3301 [[Candida] boidinii]